MDESTFHEVRSFKYRRWYPWILVLLSLGLALLLVSVLLSTGPVKAMLAKSSQIQSEELLLLRSKTLELEELASQQNLMIFKLQQLISGESIIDTAIAGDLSIAPSVDTFAAILPIAEDTQLRSEVDLEDRLSTRTPLPATTAVDRDRPMEQLYLVPPISGGTVSLGFDPTMQHLGIDVNAAAGTPVKSVLSGHIIYAGWTLETGNTVGIQHDNNLISFYKHNSALLKKQGTFVEAGEAVAVIGNSGTLSSGPHLHFELWSQGKPVDPQDFIDF